MAKKKARRGREGKNNAARAAHTHRPAPLTDDVTARISEALTSVVADAGLYLESVTAMRAGGTRVVQVTVDLPWGPGGVDSDALTDVSRAISARLDDVDLVEGAYTLEVSTPGASRPLTEPRHFSRAEGRLVAMRLVDGTSMTARIESVAGDTLHCLTENGECSVPLKNIDQARVEVELAKPKEEGE